jgi:hypothetical protein
VGLVRKCIKSLILFGFWPGGRIVPGEGSLAESSKGDVTVLVNRDFARLRARSFDLSSINDNGLEDESPTIGEILYLRRGLTQPGGKLPLFDLDGQDVDIDVVKKCLSRGWAKPWFKNPLKPDWMVCRLTELGRQVASAT